MNDELGHHRSLQFLEGLKKTSWIIAAPPSPHPPIQVSPPRKSKLLHDSRSVSMSWCRAQFGTWDQILLPAAVWKLRSCLCGAPSLTRRRVCSFQCNHSMVRVVQNPLHCLRLPQPGGPGSRIYIPQEKGSPVIPPGTGFPLRRLLRLVGLWWRYSNPPPHGNVTIWTTCAAVMAVTL
jgi:hypothetical protein